MAAAATAAVLLLGGCAAGQISQTADQVAAIDGANVTIGDLVVLNAALSQTGSGGYAVGATAPLQFTVTNQGHSADTLTSISTPVAGSVAISGTAVLPAQSLVKFSSDGGAVSATLTGLTKAVPYGSSIPITFTFQQAGSATVNVPIEISPERTDGSRPTVNIQPAEPTPLWESGAESHE